MFFFAVGEDHFWFFIKVAIVSQCIDAVHAAILLGNRVVITVPSLKPLLTDRMTWLSRLPDGVWSILAALCGQTGSVLKHECIQDAHLGAAFFQFRVLDRADAYPWKLCRGDIIQNLCTLLLQFRPADDTTGKI